MEAWADGLSPCELNNNAVACLCAGYSVEAMTLLQVSLSKLRSKFAESRDSGPKASGIDESVKQGEEFEAGPTVMPSGRIDRAECPTVGAVKDTSFLTMYRQAFLVQVDALSSDDDSALSAVVLFNMALLHHTQGLTDGKSEALERANRLYSMAVDIVLVFESPKGTCLLLLALYNNLAHLSSLLFRTDEMIDRLEQMRRILSTDGLLSEEKHMNIDDYAIFSLNTMFGSRDDFKVATAA
jgi:hypothetical protein